MIDIIITADIMGLIICFVTLYGNCFESRQDNRIKKRFSVLLSVTIVMLIVDMMSYAAVHAAVSEAVHYGVNIVANTGTFIIASAFAMYLHSYVKVKYGKDLKRLRILVAGDIIFSVVVMIGCMMKKVFSIENGVYTIGPAYGVYLALNVLMFIAALALFMSLVKIVSRHDVVALFSYILCPGIIMFVELLVPSFAVIYPGFAVMSLMIYIMLQSDSEKTFMENSIEASHRATHDALTGLLNRRAYDAMCAEFRGERRLGVIYCDINGLKYANDNFGHKAGDELLNSFSQVLLSCCRKEETFRIGGDEFVVLLPSITEDAFWDRVHLIESKTDAGEMPMASVGAAFGIQENYSGLIEYAENEMYMDKKQFYVDFPDYARE